MFIIFALLTMFLVACSSQVSEPDERLVTEVGELVEELPLTEATAAIATETPEFAETEGLQEEIPLENSEFLIPIPEYQSPNVRVDDPKTYNINASIPPDGIRPVYEPRFVSAADAPLDDEELIIGVAWGGEAKAYSITVLRFREMVNDELAGIPTLVTW